MHQVILKWIRTHPDVCRRWCNIEGWPHLCRCQGYKWFEVRLLSEMSIYVSPKDKKIVYQGRIQSNLRKVSVSTIKQHHALVNCQTFSIFTESDQWLLIDDNLGHSKGHTRPSRFLGLYDKRGWKNGQQWRKSHYGFISWSITMPCSIQNGGKESLSIRSMKGGLISVTVLKKPTKKPQL